MHRRTRHRIAVYGPNGRGAQVELRILQRSTPDLAIAAARLTASEEGLGALAYTVELGDDDEEGWPPTILARFGELPAHL